VVVEKICLKLTLVAGAVLVAVIALAAPAPPAPEPLTDTEKQGVASLHRTTVEVFIDRNGFGVRRMPLRVDDLITYPKPVPKKEGEKDKKPEIAPPQAPVADKAKDPHFAVQDLTGDDGLFRLITEDKKEVWKVRKIQLVGLVKHKEPVVYLADKMPDMKEAKEEVPTRELTTFEKDALAALKGGENLKAEKHGKEMRVLGPIYAGQRCVACHETKGQMLGAFTYELERVPYDPEKDKGPRLPRLPRE
jgi:hypothetical protein